MDTDQKDDWYEKKVKNLILNNWETYARSLDTFDVCIYAILL